MIDNNFINRKIAAIVNIFDSAAGGNDLERYVSYFAVTLGWIILLSDYASVKNQVESLILFLIPIATIIKNKTT